jgi:plasmid stabilization system protein ParE
VRRLQWREQALSDLDRIHAWLCSIEGANPDRTVLRIRAAAESLCRLGDIGRPSKAEGARELSVRNAPYVVVYLPADDVIDIVAIYHHAQQR